MTQRLYHRNAYCFSFVASVLACEIDADGTAKVQLDQTAFYPESGGQRADRGWIGGVPVLDVQEDENEMIIHLVERPLPIGPVQAQVDVTTRMDHMRQHTGQHILSAVFDRVYGFKTVGFHMSKEFTTVDLDTSLLTPDQVEEGFTKSNLIALENHPVTTHLMTVEEAASFGLRKPTAREGMIRVVEIGDCDRAACGGTHVARTGEIGAILLLGTERMKNKTRLIFTCGERSIRIFHSDRGILQKLSTSLTTGIPNLPDRIQQLQTALQTAERSHQLLQREILRSRIPTWIASGKRTGNHTIVTETLTESLEMTREVMKDLMAHQHVIAVFLLPEIHTLLVGRSMDTSLDCRPLATLINSQFGGKGGGRPEMIQMGGFLPDSLASTLEFSMEWIQHQIKEETR